MKLLAIDTSTPHLSLAVADNLKILAQRNIDLNKKLEASVIPAIEQILKKVKVTLQQLDAIAIGLGPGSFTSLRVGLATVKGLALATSKPVVGVGSLDIIAKAVERDNEQICVICDARRNQFFASLYQTRQGKLTRMTDYMLAPLTVILKEIKDKTIFTGDGLKLCAAEIRKTCAGKIDYMLADEKKDFPQARFLIPLAWERCEKNQYDDIHTLMPIYLYPADCQVKR